MSDTPHQPIGSQRMPSIAPEEWTDEIRDFFAQLESVESFRNGAKYNFTHWFANHPELAMHWLRFNQVLSRGVLDPLLREIVILRVAHRFGSDYEWNLHVQIGSGMGLEPADFEAIKAGPEDPRWSELQRLCLRAADALCLHHDLPDDLWNALSERLDRKMMMELLFLIGSYTLLAWVLRTVRMPLEDLAG